MRSVEPEVFLVARPKVDYDEMAAYLREVGGERWNCRGRAAPQHIVTQGRVKRRFALARQAGQVAVGRPLQRDGQRGQRANECRDTSGSQGFRDTPARRVRPSVYFRGARSGNLAAMALTNPRTGKAAPAAKTSATNAIQTRFDRFHLFSSRKSSR